MASGTPAPAAKKPRAARKPPANGRAPKRAAAVAVAELHGTSGPTTATFYGVTVEVPAELPSTFMMDYAELQEMQVEQHPGAIGMAAKLVKSVIGDEQWRSVRNGIAGETSTDGGAKMFGELLSLILGSMDMEPGESPASGTP